MRLLLTAIVLALNAWAIDAVLGSGTPTARKLAWVGAIVALPVLGPGAWLLSARKDRVR